MKSKRKNSLHLSYNAPITLTFSILCILIFAADTFILKGKLISAAFTCPGKIGSAVAFNFKSPVDYVKLFTHIFGSTDWTSLFLNLSFILLLGPTLEERYGSPIVALAIAVVALLTGVVNVCLLSATITGSSAVVLLMIILATVAFLDKKQMPLTFLFVLILYLAYEMYSAVKGNSLFTKTFYSFLKLNTSTFVDLVGGICGSLFGFLVAPKKPRTTKKNIHEEDTISYEDSAVKRPDYKKENSSNDETIVGKVEF